VSETDVWPAEATVITPPHVHWHWHESSSACTWPIVAFVAPGDQGVSTGTHGCGEPCAAETAGFDGDVQSANGGTFDGDTSVITPIGAVADTCAPDAEKVDGAVPSEHWRLAPLQTTVGTITPPRSVRVNPIALGFA
jgi:hypothetical protein